MKQRVNINSAFNKDKKDKQLLFVYMHEHLARERENVRKLIKGQIH